MIRTATYPPQPPRYYNGGYRYFFNGQEADNEVLGDGASLSAEFWQYDTRLGRRWNVDPVFKEYESPYACFAGNPVWFADRFGADTIFDDDKARQDFLTAYNNVINFIDELSQEIAILKEQLNNTENSKHTKRKIRKDILSEEKLLDDWNKLKSDFESIITSKVVFHYTSNPQGLQDWEMGKLWEFKSSMWLSDGVLMGNIYITVRAGKDDFVIHENRHGNQNLERTQNRSELEIEREAYQYQRIYDASAVEKIIQDALIRFHPVIATQPEFYELDDAIKDMYGLNR